MDMRFGTWNVRNIYKSSSLKAVSRELAKYKLDLVEVQEVRWNKGGTEPADDCTFLYVNGNI
jgi:exonuclease III